MLSSAESCRCKVSLFPTVSFHAIFCSYFTHILLSLLFPFLYVHTNSFLIKMYNVVIVSSVQQNDLVLYMCVCIYIYMFFFQIIFHFRLLKGIDYSSLCSLVGPCCLSILYVYSSVCESTPHFSFIAPPSPLVTISLFSMPMSLFLFSK